MKIVVGLGNPGTKYAGTRHNVGFDVLAELHRRHPGDRLKARFQGETTDVALGGQKVVLLWPLTFMNVSGASVVAAKSFFKVENEDVLIVCDDFQLPLGKLRIRASGSSGGQKGLDDCIRRLGTQQVPRLRLGIGPVPPEWDVSGFVLGRFDEFDRPVVSEMISRGADAVEAWVADGLATAMNRYNGS